MQIEGILIIFLTALIGAFFASVIPRKLKEREKFIDAANTFRSKVLNALEGVYPNTKTYWDEKLFPIFIQSIPKIESAAVEFGYFTKSKDNFNATVKEYREYCEKRIYEHCTAWDFYIEKKPDEVGPVEIFSNIVDHLLSFTVKK